MLMAYGASTLHWSVLENCIDLLVAITFHRFGGNEIDKEIPRMFGRKTKYLKKVFRRSSALSPVADMAIRAIEDAEELSDRRHLITHGSPREYHPDRIEYRWLKVTPSMHVLESHTVTLVQVRKLAEDALLTSVPLARIGERLAQELG
ncbi:MAG TPA: hypothetical protein DCG66_10800 [Brevundimonas sp.]|nr:hypothetical protein [Brevundimonas sp.]